MYHRILVPLDGSPFGEHALPTALAIADRTGAEVEVVRVHVPSLMLYSGCEFPVDPAVDEGAQEREQHYLEEVVRCVASGAGVAVQPTRLLGDSVARALAEHACSTHADLVVMTTHGRGPLSRLWLGSVADQLIRQAEVPIMLVRPEDGPLEFAKGSLPCRILVPLDGTPLAEEILRPAMELARLTKADLSLLRIVAPAVAISSPTTPERINTFGESVLKKIEEQEAACRREAETYLDGVAQRLRSEGLDVRTRVVSHESPSVAILEQAQADKADLIAMETHGRWGISRLFLGSVADKVLRGASVPLLVQRPRLNDDIPVRPIAARLPNEPTNAPPPAMAADLNRR